MNENEDTQKKKKKTTLDKILRKQRYVRFVTNNTHTS